jgi:hypothetical protein
MPLILAPADYTRWLSDEPDPGELMRPFPAEPMRMWPISTRLNKPENDNDRCHRRGCGAVVLANSIGSTSDGCKAPSVIIVLGRPYDYKPIRPGGWNGPA